MMIKVRQYGIGILIGMLLLFVICTPVRADVETEKDATALSTDIRVVGNPDAYPYEYYDADSETYKGIFPDLLSKMSEKSGINFVYVYSSSSDIRLRQQKTGKVDVVSCYKFDYNQMKNYGLDSGPMVFNNDLDGNITQIGYVFPSSCEESVKVKFTDAYNLLTDEEKLSIVSKYVKSKETKIIIGIPVYIFVGALVLLAAMAALFIRQIVRNRKLKKFNQRELVWDHLTETYNKSGYLKEFQKKVSLRFKATYYAVYFAFDIIKVNNYYGKDIAEDQLGTAASNLKELVKSSDVLARVSGGGLIAIKPFMTPESAEKWAKDALNVMNEFCKKYEGNFTPLFSAGIYQITVGENNAEEVLDNAMWAYRRALVEGSEVFLANRKSVEGKKLSSTLQHNASEGLKNDEFVQFFQPIVLSDTGEIVAAESLARWNHPKLGLLRPGRFVDLLMEAGMVAQLDLFMFEQCCVHQQKWQSLGHYYTTTTNFTRITITEPDFLSKVEEISSKYQFNHSYLVIEITEDCLEKNKSQAFNNIQYCHKLGFRIALDDLGSGYTFFSDLKEYPLDMVKIDRGLLLDTDTQKGQILYEKIVSLCMSLGISVLSEGVETEKQLNFSRQAGSKFIQGFYYYRPMPAEEFEKLVSIDKDQILLSKKEQSASSVG